MGSGESGEKGEGGSARWDDLEGLLVMEGRERIIEARRLDGIVVVNYGISFPVLFCRCWMCIGVLPWFSRSVLLVQWNSNIGKNSVK